MKISPRVPPRIACYTVAALNHLNLGITSPFHSTPTERHSSDRFITTPLSGVPNRELLSQCLSTPNPRLTDNMCRSYSILLLLFQYGL
ncbi:hypothetical protein CDAR_469861 [Caerostris darwini]|uniref:Uncharacterized protein n=1 Tax=Caerostris darwini TaxID=1538125 RepID=A0AAV4TZ04_9ARAC|nr:hypothetical protein CDAR_469861 [Caerostris darwini]